MPIKRLLLLWFLLVCPGFYAWADIQVQGYLNNAAVQNLASDPTCTPAATCPEGRIIFNTTTDQFRIYINGSWTNVSSGATFPLLAPDGTVGAPSYSFSDDTNTGIYSSANDVLDIAAGGTLSRLSISSTAVTSNEPVTITDPASSALLNLDATGGGGNLYAISSRITDELRIANTTTGLTLAQSFDTGWVFGNADASLGQSHLFYTYGSTENDYVRIGYPSLTGPGVILANDNQNSAGSWSMGTSNFYGNTTGIFQIFSSTEASVLSGTGDVQIFEINAVGQIRAEATASLLEATPTYSFDDDPDTGMYRDAANNIGFSTGATVKFVIGASTIVPLLPFRAPDGTAGAPSYSFSGDTDTGMTRFGTTGVGLFAGGTRVFGGDSGGVDLLFDADTFATTVCSSGTSGTVDIDNCTSSRRYKENIEDAPDVDSEKIWNLRPVKYKWKGRNSVNYGFIAEEVYEHLPLLTYPETHQTEDGTLTIKKDEDGKDMVGGVHYDHMTALMLAEMKKLKARIEELEAKVGE